MRLGLFAQIVCCCCEGQEEGVRVDDRSGLGLGVSTEKGLQIFDPIRVLTKVNVRDLHFLLLGYQCTIWYLSVPVKALKTA